MRKAEKIAAILVLGVMLVTIARGIAYRAGWSLPHIMPEGLRPSDRWLMAHSNCCGR